MKTIAILMIDIYKNFLSFFLKTLLGVNAVCRFEEHCDDYAKRMIKEKGIFKGIYLFFVRLLKCQPFFHVKERNTYA